MAAAAPPLPPSTAPNPPSSLARTPPPPTLPSAASAHAPPLSALSLTAASSPRSSVERERLPDVSRRTTTASTAPSPVVPPADAPPKDAARARWRPCVRLWGGHDVVEAAGSMWLSVTFVLLFRLAAMAYMVSHVMFFVLHADLQYATYGVWSFLLITFVFLLVVVSSLLELIRDDDPPVHPDAPPVPTLDDDDDDDDIRSSDNRTVRALEEGLIRSNTPTHGPLATTLAQITLPFYQLTLTAALFGAAIYWPFVHDGDIRYPPLSIHGVAPALLALDFLLSSQLRFRLVYLALLALYNLLYAVTLVLLARLSDTIVYDFLDSSTTSRAELIAKIVGLAAGGILAGVALYLLSNLPTLPCLRRTPPEKPLVRAETPRASDAASSSSDTLSRLPALADPPAESTPPSPASSAPAPAQRPVSYPPDRSVDGLATIVGNEDDVDAPESRANRSSFPMFRSPSLSSAWSRPRLAPSRSSSTIGEDARPPLVRSDSRGSNWSAELDAVTPRIDDEFFRMPALYTDGQAEEVVRLPRVDSRGTTGLAASGSAGGMRRGSSWRGIGKTGNDRRLSGSVGVFASGSVFARGENGSLGDL